MTSSVFFKFKSQKEPSRIEFDGTGISVFEVKREIISLSGLGDGKNFDLKIYNEDGMEEYDDDTTIIPRSTSIVARRMPAAQPGKGKAARYVSGIMPGNIRNNARKDQTKPKPKPTTAKLTMLNSNMTEEEKMEAMLQATGDAWSAQQEILASHATGFKGGQKKGVPPNVPNHEPPQGYVCYRCQEKGHWIQLCPTNDDPDFEKKPRVKRTTGIPRSFLKTIDKPTALMANDGTVDDTKAPSGIMINAEGQYVIAEPDKKSWEQFQAKSKTSAAAQKVAAMGDKELQDRGLECSIDKRIFIDPMKTPCCEKTYCNNCITDALIESDFTCPGCHTDDVLIDNLIPDEDASRKITEYLEEKNAAKQRESKVATPKSPSSVKADLRGSESIKSTSKTPSPPPQSLKTQQQPKAVTPDKKREQQLSTRQDNTSPDTKTQANKKRVADTLLENPTVPKAPKAMQKQQEAQQMNNLMNAMIMNSPMLNGFSPMFGNPNDMSMNMMNNFAMGMPNPMMGGMNNGMMNSFPMGMNPMMSGMGGTGMGGLGMNGVGMNGNVNGISHSRQGSFPNQQKTVFAQPLPNEEESAYMRKPVNPHRHQGRQRRARPSDYREL